MTVTLVVVTAVSLALAIAMSVVAWRAARAERRRSAARIAMLAADIHDDAPSLPRSADGAEPDLFSARSRAGHWSPLTAAAVGATIVLMAAVIGFAFSAPAPLRSTAGTTPKRPPRGQSGAQAGLQAGPITSPSTPATGAPPLELVALGHERQAESLSVRGVIRNPAGGSTLDRLDAVLLLYDRDGGYVASARAPVDRSTLAPGGESTFLVSVPAGSNIGRYRVSFRSNDRVIPHVDRRT